MMTPEPAQPAESPEARACNCAARFYGDDRNAHQLCCAASTARPTERGAVEAWTPAGFVLTERSLDDDCGCPEEVWDTPFGVLHMHLSAGKPSNACLDNGDEGEWSTDVTATTVDDARAALFGWAHVAALALPTTDQANDNRNSTAVTEIAPDAQIVSVSGVERGAVEVIKRLCEEGTQAHGDEFYGPILEALNRTVAETVTVGSATDRAAEVERLRTDIRNIQRNTAIYRQEAREEADKANKRAAEAEKRAENTAAANRKLLAMIEADPASLATQPATGQQPELPMDVRRLVVAARRALDADDWASTGKRDRMRTLDQAVEAFSSRIAYDDQPDDAQPATGRTMGGEVFDIQPQLSDSRYGPEPSLRQAVRYYYFRNGQPDPDGDTEQYFAALQNGGE